MSISKAPATPQDDEFQKIAHDYIEQYLRANPEDATKLGARVGVTERLDLRSAEQKKLGNDFNLKKYNDQVISNGSPPLKYVRKLMLLGTTASQPSS